MNIDILLLIIGAILSILGIWGCFLPILPGPPLSFAALLLLHFTKALNIPSSTLWVLGGLTVVVTLLDFIIPIWGTRRFGGTKAGAKGATLGLLVGFITGPMGMIAGPFIGAFIGEMLGGRSDRGIWKASFGSLLGFLLGIGMKLTTSLIIFYFWLSATIPFVLQL
jgi:uncharacterized protein